ncbi:MAG: tyrosine-type recombinase/integrase [Cyclobacteriaceae bacterium]|nr:tyrosine-type recombinase/integrase [Cyclobacteriaceae bacterium]
MDKRLPKTEFKITYFLRRKPEPKDGKYPLYLRSAQNDTKQHYYFTGERLLLEDWIENKRGRAKKGRPKKGRPGPGGRPKTKTAKLLELEGKLQATYRDLLDQGHKPTLPMLVIKKDDPKRPMTKEIASWCEDYCKRVNVKDGKQVYFYSEGQRKAVATLKTNLEGFHKGLTFDNLTKPKLKAFFDYLTAEGVANNSQYKRLRALINVAEHANVELTHLKDYRLPYTTTNALKPRLTWSEVKAVMETKAAPGIEQTAKDVFLLACFSGLRISDILTLNQGELNPSYYERLQSKTKDQVFVTVHKYNQVLFRQFMKEPVDYTRQRLSDALKAVLKRSGMTKPVTIVSAMGANHEKRTSPKFKEISFHSGRRFYARLLNDLGLGQEVARDELGHRFKSVTELYAGSPEHSLRISRVRTAMEGLEKKMKELSALMKVA